MVFDTSIWSRSLFQDSRTSYRSGYSPGYVGQLFWRFLCLRSILSVFILVIILDFLWKYIFLSLIAGAMEFVPCWSSDSLCRWYIDGTRESRGELDEYAGYHGTLPPFSSSIEISWFLHRWGTQSLILYILIVTIIGGALGGAIGVLWLSHLHLLSIYSIMIGCTIVVLYLHRSIYGASSITRWFMSLTWKWYPHRDYGSRLELVWGWRTRTVAHPTRDAYLGYDAWLSGFSPEEEHPLCNRRSMTVSQHIRIHIRWLSSHESIVFLRIL